MKAKSYLEKLLREGARKLEAAIENEAVDEERNCITGLMEALEAGTKELTVVVDGYRERHAIYSPNS